MLCPPLAWSPGVFLQAMERPCSGELQLLGPVPPHVSLMALALVLGSVGRSEIRILLALRKSFWEEP